MPPFCPRPPCPRPPCPYLGFDRNAHAGLPGEADTGVFVQMALASKLLRIPFLASGGVATGRQLLAALALGAAGVQIGTRFNCTQECTSKGPRV